MYGRKRPNDFHLRLSDAEYADLHEKAAKVGLGPQAYIHAVLKDKEIRELPSMDLINVLRNLTNIKCSMTSVALGAWNADEAEKATYWENVDQLNSVIRELLVLMHGE